MGAGRGTQASVRGRAGRRRQAAAAGERSGRVGVCGSWAQAGGRALGARQAGAGRAGRATWAGLGQCTRCTRPIFDPFWLVFFFLSQQMNTVHCKIKFFRKKK